MDTKRQASIAMDGRNCNSEDFAFLFFSLRKLGNRLTFKHLEQHLPQTESACTMSKMKGVHCLRPKHGALKDFSFLDVFLRPINAPRS